MIIKQITNWTVLILAKFKQRLRLISHPFENLHRVPTGPSGLITVPIPMPHPYPWESHTHGSPIAGVEATIRTATQFIVGDLDINKRCLGPNESAQRAASRSVHQFLYSSCLCPRETHRPCYCACDCVGKDRDAAQKPSQVWSLFTIPGLKMKKMKQILLLRYDTRCYFNVRSKADISRLNLPHGDDN